MLDVRLIRTDPDAVKAGLARRGDDTSAIDEIASLDGELRPLSAAATALRAEVRTISNEVGQLFRDSARTRPPSCRSRAACSAPRRRRSTPGPTSCAVAAAGAAAA